MTRKEVLEEAIRCVCTDRNEQYGEPEDSFSVIAELWEMYVDNKCRIDYGDDALRTDISIKADDVAVMMALFKIGRIITSEKAKADTFIDAAGYIACAGEIACGGNRHDMV